MFSHMHESRNMEDGIGILTITCWVILHLDLFAVSVTVWVKYYTLKYLLYNPKLQHAPRLGAVSIGIITREIFIWRILCFSISTCWSSSGTHTVFWVLYTLP